MQSTRSLAANMLRAQPATSVLKQRAMPLVRSQPARGLRLQASPVMRSVPKEEHSAHTISQRLRTLKKIPPELIPLGVVLAVALGAAGYSIARKFWTDGTLRLYRQGPNAGGH